MTENAIRKSFARLGFSLKEYRTRNPESHLYRGFYLINPRYNAHIHEGPLTLEDARELLASYHKRRKCEAEEIVRARRERTGPGGEQSCRN
jgi:hypothetical protein